MKRHILLTLLFSFAASAVLASALPPQGVAVVLEPRGKGAVLTAYKVSTTGAATIITKRYIDVFLREVIAEHEEPFTAYPDIRVRELVVSDDYKYLACYYSTFNKGAARDSLLRIYDLVTGKIVRDILPADKSSDILRPRWAKRAVLEYIDTHIGGVDEPGGEHDETQKRFDVISRKITVFKDPHTYIPLDHASFTEPVIRMGIVFDRLEIRPPPAFEQATWNYEGWLTTPWAGAVSEDGSYAVLEFSREAGPKYAVIDRDHKIGEFRIGDGEETSRLQFLGNDVLVASIEGNGKHRIEVRPLPTLRPVRMIAGQYLVDINQH